MEIILKRPLPQQSLDRNQYTSEHTVPLCNLTMGSLSQYAVNCTQQEYAEYEAGSLSAMDQGWNAYITEQCQKNYGILVARYAEQVIDPKKQPYHMYTDADYWYEHYCIELRINSLSTTRYFLSKQQHKEQCQCTSACAKLVCRRNFAAKSGPSFFLQLEYRMMTRLHSHTLEHTLDHGRRLPLLPPCLTRSFQTNGEDLQPGSCCRRGTLDLRWRISR